MSNHVGDAGDVIGADMFGDKKSHYTALLVGVIIGATSSSIVVLAVAIATGNGS